MVHQQVGLGSIFSLPNLRDLSIQDYESDTAKVAEAMADYAHSLEALTRLDMSFSFSRSESAGVGRLLPLMPDLMSLSLRAPPGDDNRSLLISEFGGTLAALTKLTLLDISGMQLTAACAAALAASLQALSELLCLGLSQVLVASADAASGDGDDAAVGSVIMHGLVVADSVRELRLEQSFLPPEALAAVMHGMPQLRDLQLSGTVLGESGARWLSKGIMHACGLHSLNLSQTFLDPPSLNALAPALAALGSLTLLDLSYNQMGREGAVELAEALCPQASSRKRKSVAALPQLVVLDLSFSRLGRDGLAALQSGLLSLPSLRELNLRQGERVVSTRTLEELRSARPDLYILY